MGVVKASNMKTWYSKTGPLKLSQMYGIGTAPLSGMVTMSGAGGTYLFTANATSEKASCTAAYSIRRVKGDFTGPVVNIRNGNTQATADFYADEKGNLNTSRDFKGSSLTTWLAGATGYVQTLYNQHGTAGHITQGTQSKQPSITGGSNSMTFNAAALSQLKTTTVPWSAGLKTLTIYADATETSGITAASQVIAEQGPSTFANYQRASLMLFLTSWGWAMHNNDYQSPATRVSGARMKMALSLNDTLSSNNVRMYINASSGTNQLYVGATSQPTLSNIQTSGGFQLGTNSASTSGEPFGGTIREVLCFNTNLSDTSITNLATTFSMA